MPTDEVAAMVHDWMELFPVAVADGCILREAIRLKAEHGFASWDAMLVRAARSAEVIRLLTEDMQDGRMIGALRLENRFTAGFDLGVG
jgi:predicted nucleic acid-binding protein